LLIWAIATYLAIVVSSFMTILILVFVEMHPLLFDDPGTHMIEISVGLMTLVSVVGIGTVVGVAQWSILRRYVVQSVMVWVGVTILGFLIVGLIDFSTVMLRHNTAWPGLLRNTIAGSALGVLQWAVLRKKVNRALLWVAGSLTSWFVAALFAGAIAGSINTTLPWILIPNFEFFGTILSTFGLWMFLKHATSSAEMKTHEGIIADPPTPPAPVRRSL